MRVKKNLWQVEYTIQKYRRWEVLSPPNLVATYSDIMEQKHFFLIIHPVTCDWSCVISFVSDILIDST